MSLQRRTRTVSIRLTESEYSRLRELSFSYGMRSVSDMARSALNTVLQQDEHSHQELTESRLCEIENRVHMITGELKRIGELCPKK